MNGPLEALVQLLTSSWTLFVYLLLFLLQWSLVIVWVAWWLLAVDWRKAWPVLARGAWVPAVLLVIVASLTWAKIWPRTLNVLPGFSVPNFWWQFLAVSALAGTALICGWVQVNFGWYPTEVEIEPPAEAGHAAAHHH